jgi:hypothetical protein
MSTFRRIDIHAVVVFPLLAGDSMTTSWPLRSRGRVSCWSLVGVCKLVWVERRNNEGENKLFRKLRHFLERHCLAIQTEQHTRIYVWNEEAQGSGPCPRTWQRTRSRWPRVTGGRPWRLILHDAMFANVLVCPWKAACVSTCLGPSAVGVG